MGPELSPRRGHRLKRPKQNCPRCNSKQTFALKTEEFERDGETWIKGWIRCLMCHWRKDVIEEPLKVYRLRTSIPRLEEAVSNGRPVKTLLRRTRRKLKEESTKGGS